MNRVIAAVVLLVLSLSISFTDYFLIKNTTRDLIDLMKEDRTLTVEQSQPSFERAEEIQKKWKEKENVLVAFLPHLELDVIEISIRNLTDFQKQGLNEEYVKALNECINRLEHISESEKPDFKTIF